MKKALALLLAAALLMLCACGAPAEKPAVTQAPETTASPTQEPSPEPAVSPTATPTPAEQAAAMEETEEATKGEEKKTAPSAEAPSASAAPEKIPEEAPEEETELWDSTRLLSLGTIDGDTYKNESLGFGCRLPEGWAYQDEEFLRVINQVGESILTEDWQEIIREQDVFTDMYAMTGGGTQTVCVQIQNMNHLYGMILSEDAIVDAALEAVLTTEMLESAGYADPVREKISLEFMGEEHTGIMITGKLYNMPIYQKEVMIKCGSYIAVIVATSFMEDSTDELLSFFFKLPEA